MVMATRVGAGAVWSGVGMLASPSVGERFPRFGRCNHRPNNVQISMRYCVGLMGSKSTVALSPMCLCGRNLRWELRKVMICPVCVSSHCAVTTHQLLKSPASTCICVMVATTCLLSLLVFRLLKSVARPMIKMMRMRANATTRIIICLSMFSSSPCFGLFVRFDSLPKCILTLL